MKRIEIPFALSLVLAAAGCDGRAGTDYQGESLMRVAGSVRIDNDYAPPDLVPALVFQRRGTIDYDVVDVDVRGEFPARFEFDVFVPPPESALLKPKIEGEPRFAFGRIAAVAADHAPYLGNYSREESMANCVNGECREEHSWCNRDDCYIETRLCNADLESCKVLEATGDPDVKKTLKNQVGGFSTNFSVMYFAEDAPADSLVASMFTGGRAMSKGYHLFRLIDFTEAEEKAGYECQLAVQAEVLESFNAEHGTEYAAVIDVPADDANYAPVYRAYQRAINERGCMVGSARAEEVDRNGRTPVEIEISPPVDHTPPADS